ncbi:MAG: hypothetical protein M1832_006058 [Thelocarpon impressellum]|nr:MAG: hypothetical protein M1832_006058 [Thelocarpon impressellum]
MATKSAQAGSAASAEKLKLRNRLDESRSPYVRGHMRNPVAWQIWSPEAIQLARKHNRLIFLSIGYAACHWCHVMERESFENDEVARLLNASFIPIKVDREERPDVDRIYMNYVQATTGSGGWPLNVFITPGLEPVFGGTYWPGPASNAPALMPDQVGFLEILKKIRDVWDEQEARCLESAKDILAQLREFAEEGNHGRVGGGAEGEGLELDLLEEAYQHFAGRYDKVNGGFAVAPKFPTPANLSFLLRLGAYPSAVQDVVGDDECENAAFMALTTLRNMTRGGIHDQVGHGFARYSVTADWSLPHFEKMLYDQAQLLNAYLDAFLVSRDPEMLGAVYDISDYLTLDALAAPRGGFHSAEDADSYHRPADAEKREGAFYLWTRKEFDTILGEREAEVCAKFWNVNRHGNVAPENDAHDEFMDQNVLAVVSTPAQLAKDFGMSEEEVVKIIKDGRRKLRAHRDDLRPRPKLDDKIVTSWNGLAIGALARTSAVLESIDAERASAYRACAERAVAFIRRNLLDERKATLKRVYREGPGDTPGFADDYAFLIAGLLDLYQATFDEDHLELADRLQKTQLSLFWDSSTPTSSAFFSTVASAPDLILRLKDGMDSAEPSTNGLSAQNLHRLSSLLNDESYAAYARKTCQAFEAEIMQHPFLFSSLLPAVVAGALGTRSIVVVGAAEEEAVKRLRAQTTLSGLTTIARYEPGGWLARRNALLATVKEGDEARVMVCEGGTCREEALLPGGEVGALDMKALETVVGGIR